MSQYGLLAARNARGTGNRGRAVLYLILEYTTGLGQNVQLAKRRVPPRVRTAAQHWWAANTLIYGI